MSNKEPRDTGTPELSRQRTVIPRLRPIGGYSYDLYVADGSEPDRLLLKGVISVNEHATLLAFVIMLHKARMLGPKGPSFEVGSSSDPAYMSGKMAEAMGRVGAITRELDKSVGKKARYELINVCMSINTLDKNREPMFSKSVDALRDALDST